MMDVGSISATVASLLASYPVANGYAGYCVQLFPSPSWRSADAPCEGTDAFPDDDAVAGVALFSLKCLATSDFDWRTISTGYRPGGVTAMTSVYADVTVFSNAPVCSQRSNTDLAMNVVGMTIQGIFTQNMVGPLSAMLFMDVKNICSGGFEADACLRFENVMDLFFESWSAAQEMATAVHADMICLILRSDIDPLKSFEADVAGH